MSPPNLSNHLGNAIRTVCESAIMEDVPVERLLQELRAAWNEALADKARADDQKWREACRA